MLVGLTDSIAVKFVGVVTALGLDAYRSIRETDSIASDAAAWVSERAVTELMVRKLLMVIAPITAMRIPKIAIETINSTSVKPASGRLGPEREDLVGR
jgi:hypothetical protein